MNKMNRADTAALKISRLALRRETLMTLRILTRTQLGQVNGGSVSSGDPLCNDTATK